LLVGAEAIDEVTAREHAGACGNWPRKRPLTPQGAKGHFGPRSARPYPGARFTAYLAL